MLDRPASPCDPPRDGDQGSHGSGSLAMAQAHPRPVLRRSVRGITRLRRWTRRPVLDRLQLYLIAWREALDPERAVWIAEAKRSVADGTAAAEAWTVDDLRA